MGERYEVGPNVIEVTPDAFGGHWKSASWVALNGARRAHLTFPMGYGGRWSLHPLRDSVAPVGRHHGRSETALFAGKEARRELILKLPALVADGWFPVEIESASRAAANKALARARAEEDNRRGRAADIERGHRQIAKRLAAVDHLEALESIHTGDMSNRQAVAIGAAVDAARAEVAKFYDDSSWAFQRKERAQRELMDKEREREALAAIGRPLTDEEWALVDRGKRRQDAVFDLWRAGRLPIMGATDV